MTEERPERPAEVDGTAHLFSALGKQIKVLRENASMSQRELGVAAHCGEDLISAMERGVRTPQPDFLVRADELLAARGVLKAAVEDVRKAQAKARTRHPEWYRDYAGLEAEAIELHDYSARSCTGFYRPRSTRERSSPNGDPCWTRRPSPSAWSTGWPVSRCSSVGQLPTCSFILEEAALQRPIGGRAIHKYQLLQLLRIGRLRTVELPGHAD